MIKHQEAEAGALYVVATPIGNLADFSQRAINILKKANRILAEDTRHTQILLQHHGIHVPLQALHRFNETERCKKVAILLQKGQVLALVSDAGTPVISDPGARIINYLHERQYKVIPIPGASALTTALSGSGLAGDRFVFEGFLPTKHTARVNRLNELKTEIRTLIFYEAPHRIVAMLHDLQQVFGATRKGVVAKELTKSFETIKTGTLVELNDWVNADPDRQKGEFVVLSKGQEVTVQSTVALTSEQVLEPLLHALPLKQAVKLATEITSKPRNELYQAALNLSKQLGDHDHEQ